MFDSNGGGTIDAEELDLALQSVGIKLNHEDLAGVLETMDKDGRCGSGSGVLRPSNWNISQKFCCLPIAHVHCGIARRIFFLGCIIVRIFHVLFLTGKPLPREYD